MLTQIEPSLHVSEQRRPAISLEPQTGPCQDENFQAPDPFLDASARFALSRAVQTYSQ